MSELKDCPMCGNQPRLVDLEGWEIWCKCGVQLCLEQPDKEPLVEVWNHRAPVSTPQQSAQRASVDTLSAIADSIECDGLVRTAAKLREEIAHINAWGSAGSGAVDGWIDVRNELPQPGERVLVARYAGRVANAEHPGYPGKPWIEVSLIPKGFTKFLCDLSSTGSVTHWKRDAAPSPAPQGEQA